MYDAPWPYSACFAATTYLLDRAVVEAEKIVEGPANFLDEPAGSFWEIQKHVATSRLSRFIWRRLSYASSNLFWSTEPVKTTNPKP